MTPRRPESARPLVIGLLVCGTVLVVALNFNDSIALTDRYFSVVGKTNSNAGRLALWASGIEKFKESPIIGRAFTEGTATDASVVRGALAAQLPYHNDYIYFLATGGIIGLGLLLVWIAATETLAIRRYLGFRRVGEHAKADLLRVLLIGYNAFFLTAIFNPSIAGMSRAATIFSIYAMMMALGKPRADPESTRESLKSLPEVIRA
jgi:O-antigen ligase